MKKNWGDAVAVRRKSYSGIFRANENCGTVEEPNGMGFIRLAQAGRDVWNEWRTDNPPTWNETENKWRGAVHWTGIPLEDYPDLDFSGFDFGDGANFQDQIFKRAQANFEGAIFGANATLTGIRFEAGATFKGARFGPLARLHLTIHEKEQGAAFERAAFGDNAEIVLAFVSNFIESCSLRAITFGKDGKLMVYHVHGEIVFDGSRFGDRIDLSNAIADADVSFRNCVFGEHAKFNWRVSKSIDLTGSEIGADADFCGSEFRKINFTKAKFLGAVDFSNREFQDKTSFDRATFKAVPLFHNCKLHQDTHFDEQSFPEKPTGIPGASRAYRTLKLEMNRHQAIRQEQFFFRMEMREERLELAERGHRFRSFLYGLYDWLSEYGASVSRPIGWYFFIVLVGAFVYAWLSGSAPFWAGSGAIDYTQTLQWLTYSFANSLPLGGLEEASKELKTTLRVTGTWLPAILVIHKVASLLFLFLMGLALRNLFKMK